ncbi:MAG: M20/M25/M40 family metallo-hydrolase [Acidimicrobiales bacterium]
MAQVLDAVAELTDPLLDELAMLVRIPSVSGSDAENDAQAHVAGRLAAAGLDVDHWPIDLAALSAHPDFPGTEVERREAWGLVGRLPGAGDGATLMLNGHVDVVPVGDPDMWNGPPFSADIRAGRLHGRGSCDMKAGLIASLWAVQALRMACVRLRGDVVLASVQGEEDGGLGTFATLQRGWRADACVIAEPTELDVVPRELRRAHLPPPHPRPGHARGPAHRGRERDREVLAGLAGSGRARTPPPRVG